MSKVHCIACQAWRWDPYIKTDAFGICGRCKAWSFFAAAPQTMAWDRSGIDTLRNSEHAADRLAVDLLEKAVESHGSFSSLPSASDIEGLGYVGSWSCHPGGKDHNSKTLAKFRTNQPGAHRLTRLKELLTPEQLKYSVHFAPKKTAWDCLLVAEKKKRHNAHVGPKTTTAQGYEGDVVCDQLYGMGLVEEVLIAGRPEDRTVCLTYHVQMSAGKLRPPVATAETDPAKWSANSVVTFRFRLRFPPLAVEQGKGVWTLFLPEANACESVCAVVVDGSPLEPAPLQSGGAGSWRPTKQR